MKKPIIRVRLLLLKGQYLVFDVLSNVTNANKYFVRKKIYVGVAIMALSVINSCSSSEDKKVNVTKKNGLPGNTTSCYAPITPVIIDTSPKIDKKVEKVIKSLPKMPPVVEDKVMCYSPVSVKEDPPVKQEDINMDTLFALDPILIVSCYLAVSPWSLNQIDADINKDMFSVVDPMPEFPGGIDSLTQFIQKNLKYPDDALKMGISGRVTLQLLVNKIGEIEETKVSHSVCTSIDEEAIRIVKLMPKWNPGRMEGKEVNAYCLVPVDFKIKKD